MASYDLTGTVKIVLDLQTFDSGFSKREFVVTTEGERYPQDVKFECVRDKVTLADNLNAGDRVTVTFDVRGNEYNGRYFVNLSAWRVETAGAAGDAGGNAGGASAGGGNTGGGFPSDGPPVDQLTPPGDEIDDMPF